MTHTGPPKRVTFGPDSLEISDISTGKIIVKGVANHASKAYEFSHFLPYSDPVQPQLPFKRRGKKILSTPFVNDVLSKVSYSQYEEQDQHDLDIEIEPQEDLYPYPFPIPNHFPKPKWSQNPIEAAGDGTGNPEDKRRTQSQYQNEHVALSHTASLST